RSSSRATCGCRPSTCCPRAASARAVRKVPSNGRSPHSTTQPPWPSVADHSSTGIIILAVTPNTRRLRIATYNIHRCRGLDGRTRPDRIAAVLRAVNADVVALQEVIGPGAQGGGHAEALGAALGMGWVMAPARQLRGHEFGKIG